MVLRPDRPPLHVVKGFLLLTIRKGGAGHKFALASFKTVDEGCF